MLLNDETQQFELGGVNVLEIVETYGSPLFVYDSSKIISQYEKMKQALCRVKKLKINYACKALTNLSILSLLKNLGAGLDAVSYQEILLGLEAGFAAEDIIYTPNSVSIEELEAAMKLGVKINIDNITAVFLSVSDIKKNIEQVNLGEKNDSNSENRAEDNEKVEDDIQIIDFGEKKKKKKKKEKMESKFDEATEEADKEEMKGSKKSG